MSENKTPSDKLYAAETNDELVLCTIRAGCTYYLTPAYEIKDGWWVEFDVHHGVAAVIHELDAVYRRVEAADRAYCVEQFKTPFGDAQ